MSVQFLKKDGVPAFAVIPIDEFNRLMELADDAIDRNAVEEFDRALTQGREELIPSAVIERLMDEPPLRVWREYRGLTQEQLAAAVGITKAYISQIELGQKTGSAKVLARIAETLKIELEDLLKT